MLKTQLIPDSSDEHVSRLRDTAAILNEWLHSGASAEWYEKRATVQSWALIIQKTCFSPSEGAQQACEEARQALSRFLQEVEQENMRVRAGRQAA